MDLGKTECRPWFILYLLCIPGCVWVYVVLVKERAQYSPHHIVVLLHLRCSWCATFQGTFYFPLLLIDFPLGKVVYCSLFFVGGDILFILGDLNSAGRYSTLSFTEFFPAELGWLWLDISQRKTRPPQLGAFWMTSVIFVGIKVMQIWVEFGHICDISIRSVGIFWGS